MYTRILFWNAVVSTSRTYEGETRRHSAGALEDWRKKGENEEIGIKRREKGIQGGGAAGEPFTGGRLDTIPGLMKSGRLYFERHQKPLSASAALLLPFLTSTAECIPPPPPHAFLPPPPPPSDSLISTSAPHIARLSECTRSSQTGERFSPTVSGCGCHSDIHY